MADVPFVLALQTFRMLVVVAIGRFVASSWQGERERRDKTVMEGDLAAGMPIGAGLRLWLLV